MIGARLIRRARAALFWLLLILWLLAASLVCWPLALGPRRPMLAAYRIWSRGVVLLMRVALGIRCVVIGRAHLPPGPCLIAAKHQSAWETLALPALLGDVAFVLKQELLRVPLYGWWARRLGMIAVDRAGGAAALRRMAADAAAALAAGRTVVIFPQGTRTPPGLPASEAPYQPGVAALAALADAPVVPVALNSGQVWGRGLFGQRPGVATVSILPALPAGLPRRELTARLAAAIEAETARLERLPGGPAAP